MVWNFGLKKAGDTVELVSTHASGNTVCHYTFDTPTEGWYATDFKDNGWRYGRTPIGNLDDICKSRWERSDPLNLWYRTDFDCDIATEQIYSAKLVYAVDDYCHVYLNGQLIFSSNERSAHHDLWEVELTEAIVSNLRNGKNVLAVKATDIGIGERLVDVGITVTLRNENGFSNARQTGGKDHTTPKSSPGRAMYSLRPLRPAEENVIAEDDNIELVESGEVLTGTQVQQQNILDGSYVVRDQYVVPEGSELLIRKGSTIVFDTNAGFIIQGRLTCEGTEKANVVFKGKGAGLSAWQGIKFFGFGGSTIEFAHISGAKIAIELSKASVALTSCTFYRNEKVLHTVGHYSSGSILENCMMTRNINAVSYHFATLELINCTITDNESAAVEGSYYGDIKLSRCIVTKNGKGIKDGGYDGKAEAHDCIIYNNKEFDVQINSSQAGNFTGNWWGPRNTAILQRKGSGVRLDKHMGNFINIADFLLHEPPDCGAKNYPKVK